MINCEEFPSFFGLNISIFLSFISKFCKKCLPKCSKSISFADFIYKYVGNEAISGHYRFWKGNFSKIGVYVWNFKTITKIRSLVIENLTRINSMICVSHFFCILGKIYPFQYRGHSKQNAETFLSLCIKACSWKTFWSVSEKFSLLSHSKFETNVSFLNVLYYYLFYLRQNRFMENIYVAASGINKESCEICKCFAVFKC